MNITRTRITALSRLVFCATIALFTGHMVAQQTPVCTIQDPRDFTFVPLQNFFAQTTIDDNSRAQLKESLEQTPHDLTASTSLHNPLTWHHPIKNSWDNIQAYYQIDHDLPLLSDKDATTMGIENLTNLKNELPKALAARTLPGIQTAVAAYRSFCESKESLYTYMSNEPLIWLSCAAALSLATYTVAKQIKLQKPTLQPIRQLRLSAIGRSIKNQTGDIFSGIARTARYTKKEVGIAGRVIFNK